MKILILLTIFGLISFALALILRDVKRGYSDYNSSTEGQSAEGWIPSGSVTKIGDKERIMLAHNPIAFWIWQIKGCILIILLIAILVFSFAKLSGWI